MDSLLREYLPIKKVKRVLWVFWEGNDVLNLSTELNYPILLKYFNDQNFTQNLHLKQDQINEKVYLKVLEAFPDAELIDVEVNTKQNKDD